MGGTGAARAREMPAAELVRTLAARDRAAGRWRAWCGCACAARGQLGRHQRPDGVEADADGGDVALAVPLRDLVDRVEDALAVRAGHLRADEPPPVGEVELDQMRMVGREPIEKLDRVQRFRTSISRVVVIADTRTAIVPPRQRPSPSGLSPRRAARRGAGRRGSRPRRAAA